MKVKTDVRSRLGDLAPRYVQYSEDILFGDLWKNEELSPKDRSLATISAIISGGNFTQLPFHIKYGIENGLTEKEIIETITHICFYVGWPKADSALAIAKDLFSKED